MFKFNKTPDVFLTGENTQGDMEIINLTILYLDMMLLGDFLNMFFSLDLIGQQEMCVFFGE